MIFREKIDDCSNDSFPSSIIPKLRPVMVCQEEKNIATYRPVNICADMRSSWIEKSKCRSIDVTMIVKNETPDRSSTDVLVVLEGDRTFVSPKKASDGTVRTISKE